MDAIAILTDDHRRIERIFREFSEDHDMSLASEVCLELTQHARAEEAHIYPIIEMHDEALAKTSTFEHQAMNDVIARVQGGSGDVETVSYMGQLREEIAHHVECEERTTFPLLRSVLSADQLEAIGAAMQSERSAVI